MSGVFLGRNTTLRVSGAKSRALRLSTLIDGTWVGLPGRFKLRNGGAFWSTKAHGQSPRLVRSWGRTYLVARNLGGTGTFFSDQTAGQRARSRGSLSAAWQARVGHRWLLANEDPSSLNWTNAGTPTVVIETIPSVSGYLLAKGALVESVPFDATTSDTLGTMFLQVPQLSGRDLYDCDFSMRDGEEFLSFSSGVLRPAATVPGLSAGGNAVTIGAKGLVRWYRVSTASNVTLSGQSDWRLFDDTLSILDSGGGTAVTKQAPAGAHLAVFGPAGSTATVVVE